MSSLLSSFKSNPQYAIDAEASTRAAADTTLQSSIASEVTSRQAADTVLQNNINAEVTSRVAAVNALQTAVDAKVPTSALGVTVATLVGGTIPVVQLPSYVDDVVEYASLAAFPATGESGKIYVAKDTNKTYRWSGSVYVFITSGAVDSVNGKTGVVTLTKADVGLGSVDNVADSSRNVLSATKLTTARTLSVSGDITGSVSFDGSSNANITATLANSGVGAGAYRYVTVDAKGRVIGGSNPTTLGGYGITDALPITGGTVTGSLAVSNNSEAQVMVSVPGYDSVYLYSNASRWGLYSDAGGSIIHYNRANGRIYVGNVDTQEIVKNNWGTYSISVTGSAGTALALVAGNYYQVAGIGVGTPAAGSAGDVRATGNITAFYSSDARLKENVVTIPSALSIVNQLRGVRFDWTAEYIEKNGGEDGYFIRKNDIGVIADELEVVLPELVATKQDGYKGVKYDRICAVLIEAIKELDKKVSDMQKKIDFLESK